MSADYNYPSFPRDLDAAAFAGFRDALPVGSSAPDGEPADAATGEPVSLSSLWKQGPLVLEFGSIS